VTTGEVLDLLDHAMRVERSGMADWERQAMHWRPPAPRTELVRQMEWEARLAAQVRDPRQIIRVVNVT
jgi:hypothetical protein